jgi:hypothetical protein
MTMHYTPNYGIAYIDSDTAAVDIATASQSAATTIDAALTAGGVTPPGASDYVALVGRVNLLENRARASLRQSAAQTGLTAGSVVDILMQTEDIDSANGHSTSTNTNRWTCPTGEAGVYLLSGGVTFGAVTAGSVVNVQLVKNGTALPNGAGGGATQGGAAGVNVGVPGRLVTLAAGDWVGVRGYCAVAWSTAVFPDACSSLTLVRIF